MCCESAGITLAILLFSGQPLVVGFLERSLSGQPTTSISCALARMDPVTRMSTWSIRIRFGWCVSHASAMNSRLKIC